MFGKNPIRKQDLSSPDQLWVQEIFGTIQGEGPFAGEAAIFVRLGGCNLRCWWCDTDFESSTWMPKTVEVVTRVGELLESCTAGLVVLTGGEPMRQDISRLVKILLRQGFRVQIETNGTLWLDSLEDVVHNERFSIVCSPKTGKVHPKIEYHASAFKYIVSASDQDPEDGLPVLSTQVRDKENRLARAPEGVPVYVQPLDMHGDTHLTASNEQHAVDLVKKHGYRLSYQMHKHLGLP